MFKTRLTVIMNIMTENKRFKIPGFLNVFKRFLNKLLKKKKVLKLGIYGATNAGKTTIANRICQDWIGEEMGAVSNIPHETRQVQTKENITMESSDGKKIIINLVDTPGIATKIDYEEFLKYGISRKKAKIRAKEATQGIIESIKWLDKMNVVLAVMDSTLSPYNQVNLTILGNLEARGIPVIVVCNKIDLKTSKPEHIKSAFPQYKTVSVSAKTGENFDELYKAIFEAVK